MSCYHPLHCFYTGLKTKNNKDLVIIQSGTCLGVPISILLRDKYRNQMTDDELNDLKIGYDYLAFKYSNFQGKNLVFQGEFVKYKEIPCGKCIGCKLDYSRTWAIRCMNEFESVGKTGLFLTLTYNNECVNVREFNVSHAVIEAFPPLSINSHNGKAVYSVLIKKDLQDFQKRLRKYLDDYFPKEDHHISYFCCGEYGGSTFRSHFHGCYFGLDRKFFPDIKTYKDHGSVYWKSAILDRIWNKGNVIIGDISFESCAYVARYVLKKKMNDAIPCPASEKYPEFVVMSRRPAIGLRYLQDHESSLIDTGRMPVKRNDNAFNVSLPLYYRRKLGDQLDYLKPYCPDPFHSTVDLDYAECKNFETICKNSLNEEIKKYQIKVLKLRNKV